MLRSLLALSVILAAQKSWAACETVLATDSSKVSKTGDSMTGVLSNPYGFVGPLTGNADTCTALSATPYQAPSGSVCIGVGANGDCHTGGVDSSAASASTRPVQSGALFTHAALSGSSAHSATSANTVSQIVARDSYGSFSASTAVLSAITVSTATNYTPFIVQNATVAARLDLQCSSTHGGGFGCDAGNLPGATVYPFQVGSVPPTGSFAFPAFYVDTSGNAAAYGNLKSIAGYGIFNNVNVGGGAAGASGIAGTAGGSINLQNALSDPFAINTGTNTSSSPALLWNALPSAAGDLFWWQKSGAAKMRMDTSGDLAIGNLTACSTCTLHVQGSAAVTGTMQAGTVKFNDGTSMTSAASGSFSGTYTQNSTTTVTGNPIPSQTSNSAVNGNYGVNGTTLTLTTNGRAVWVLFQCDASIAIGNHLHSGLLVDGAMVGKETASNKAIKTCYQAATGISCDIGFTYHFTPTAASHTFSIWVANDNGAATTTIPSSQTDSACDVKYLEDPRWQ